MNIILTGATGMIGEGVLLQCLANPNVEQVLSVGRKPSGRQHPKLRELIVDDFLHVSTDNDALTGYDACFYCAGVSSNGMNEPDYTHITFDTTLHFAAVVLEVNPKVAFFYVSGAGTDESEKGRLMWARVKGKTENALQKMAFKKVFCFRPGLLKPSEGQTNVNRTNKVLATLYPVLSLFLPHCTTRDVGLAMIYVSRLGYPQQIINSKDIEKIARNGR